MSRFQKYAGGDPLAPPVDLAEALDAVRERHPGELPRVLQRCSFLVDGDPVGTRGHETVRLAEGGTVEVLPPFAGG